MKDALRKIYLRVHLDPTSATLADAIKMAAGGLMLLDGWLPKPQPKRRVA